MSKWEDDAPEELDPNDPPEWWEIILAFVIMFVVIAVLLISSWVVG